MKHKQEPKSRLERTYKHAQRGWGGGSIAASQGYSATPPRNTPHTHTCHNCKYAHGHGSDSHNNHFCHNCSSKCACIDKR